MDRAADLINQYMATRLYSEEICKDLLIEDYVIQAMDDVSPPKWHLAHTTWFFEAFILNQYTDNKHSDPVFNVMFNSYYQGIGKPFPRSKRGLLARPSVQHIYEYRNSIDTQLIALINKCSAKLSEEFYPLITLGINHEQQHQELLLMDIKYNFFINPGLPVYRQKPLTIPKISKETPARFFEVDGGLVHIGYEGDGFCFDNELPRHQKFIQPFSISDTLITNGEYLDFINDNGYSSPDLWLADGWAWLQNNQLDSPLYWQQQEGQWTHFTLHGSQPLDLAKPVSHISYYEADAFARWKDCRLPIEEEWEHAARQLKFKCSETNFLENKLVHLDPLFAGNSAEHPFFGDLWEWTASAYLPYPQYRPLKGVVGEYNGKFMNNQRILRGGSFATPRHHMRTSYRNFYGPDKRWLFSGIRLAKDI